MTPGAFHSMRWVFACPHTALLHHTNQLVKRETYLHLCNSTATGAGEGEVLLGFLVYSEVPLHAHPTSLDITQQCWLNGHCSLSKALAKKKKIHLLLRLSLSFVSSACQNAHCAQKTVWLAGASSG